MTIKCVIYTRKSTEHGLEQEFNSLQNQELARHILHPRDLMAGSITRPIVMRQYLVELWNGQH